MLVSATLVLAGCIEGVVGVPEPLDSDTSTSDGADSTTPATTGIPPSPGSFSGSGQLPGGESSTTLPPEDTGECPCPPDQQCIGGVCFDCLPTCPDECDEGESCQCPPDDPCCDVASCMPVECPLPPLAGNYAACHDPDGTASDVPCEGATCVADSDSQPTAGVCIASGCESVCQCPPAPPTGEAGVTCEDVTGDGTADCWLTCESGETCPDGMFCFGGFICLFAVGEGVEVPLYGDCASVPGAMCADGGVCITAPGFGVCARECSDVDDCGPAPATGTAVPSCDDITGDMVEECWLGCANGETCPDGMECFADAACLWPEVPPP